jgi:hypothetical protein
MNGSATTKVLERAIFERFALANTFYSRIRCGVIHQLFHKNALIGARQNSTICIAFNYAARTTPAL